MNGGRPRLVRGNVSARLVVDELEQLQREAALEWFDEYCTFEIPTWVRGRGMGRPKRSVEKVRLFDLRTGKFPGGLLHMARRAARDDAMDAIDRGQWDLAPLARIQVEDARKPPAEVLPRERWQKAAPWLFSVLEDGRDFRFQADAAARAVERVAGILQIPTGGGKTEVAVGLSCMVLARWLFLVPNRDLLEQAAARYEKLTGLPAGRVGDGKWLIPEESRFVVATFQTLARRFKERDPEALYLVGQWAQGLIVDECHTLPAESFYAVASETRAAYWRIGISATPLERGDRRSALAVAALGPIIYRISVAELDARKVISMPTIHMVPCLQHLDAATWQGEVGAGLTRSTRRNRVLLDIALHRAARPGLLFVKELRHGRELTSRLAAAGLSVQFIWGAKRTETRRRAGERLEQGVRDFIVCNVVWQQGIDLPSIRSIINGAAGASSIAAIQRVGRGTRRTADKSTVEVWDILDQGGRKSVLARWSRARLRAYEEEGFPIVHELDLSASRSRDPRTAK